MTNKQKIADFLTWLEDKKMLEVVEMMNEWGEEGNVKQHFNVEEVMEFYEEYLEDKAGLK